MNSASARRLTARNFGHAVRELSARDGDLAAVVERYGRPRFWSRRPGFPSLVQIILEQQVSLASARAAYDRLLTLVDGLCPDSFLALDDARLRRAGFSRQKTRYCRGLARAVQDGSLRLDALGDRSDDDARSQLQAIVGIGRWTADIYLLCALGRGDVWPVGDLALVAAVRSVKGLETRPSNEDMRLIAEPWRPWRAAAARLLWHHYLSGG